eukprot:2179167-Pleurochrysis_carterae.AAC.1
MAFIKYGDAAFSNHIVRTKRPRETLAVYSSVMQSYDAVGIGAYLRKSHVARRHRGRHALRHGHSLGGQRKCTSQLHAD